uniref:Coiled-coil domain-containing protein 57-like n=1 Tax=Gouania willdenowi TaxID=441366 RepID=A0A8C5H910_GOUWI
MESPGFLSQSKKDKRWRCGNIKVLEPERERFQQLERSLRKAQEENSCLRKLFHQLSEAFHFNLALLDDQNKELKTYDSVITKALTQEHNSNVQEETQKYMDKCYQMKLELQHKIQDVAGELACQKEMKLLSKESDIYCMTLKATKRFCQRLQTQLQHTYDKILNITTITDSRIKKLEEKLEFMEMKLKEKEDQVKKFEDMVPALQSMNADMKSQCQAQAENLHKTEEQIVSLKDNLEVFAAQAQNVQEAYQQAVQQRNVEIQRLFTALEETRNNWDQYVTETSREIVEKNTEVIMLQKRAAKLSTDVERSREQMERYKEQLNAGLRREINLEQMKVQLELDWQSRFEDLKSDHFLNNEQLIEALSQARDQAEAELRVKEQEVKELTIMFRSVQAERDQAVQSFTPKVDPLASGEIQRLQEQNNSLCAAISQMREQIQSLTLLRHAKDEVIAPSTAALSCEPVLKKQNAATQTCACDHSASANAKQTGTRLWHNQEDVFYLQQQMELSGMSYQCRKRNAPLLYSRLKQAVSFIVRLSAEKQQLIEIVNRLRSQASPCDAQEPVVPEREISVKEPGVKQNQLSALEQQQYKLTTQSHKKRSKPLPMNWPETPHSDLSSWHLSSAESQQDLRELWEVVDHELSLDTSSEGEIVQRRKEAAKLARPVLLKAVLGKRLTETKGKAAFKTPSNVTESSRYEAARRQSRVRLEVL